MKNVVIFTFVFFLRISFTNGEFRFKFYQNKTDMKTAFQTCKAANGSLVNSDEILTCDSIENNPTGSEPLSIWTADYKRYSPWLYYRGCYRIEYRKILSNIDKPSDCVVECMSNGKTSNVVAFNQINRTCVCQSEIKKCSGIVTHSLCFNRQLRIGFLIFEAVSLNISSDKCYVFKTEDQQATNSSFCGNTDPILYEYSILKQLNVGQCYKGNDYDKVTGYFQMLLDDKALKDVSTPINCTIRMLTCNTDTTNKNTEQVDCTTTKNGFVCKMEYTPTSSRKPTTAAERSTTTFITTDIETTPYTTENTTIITTVPTTNMTTKTEEITTYTTDLPFSFNIIHPTNGIHENDTSSMSMSTTNTPSESSSQYSSTKIQRTNLVTTEIKKTKMPTSTLTDKPTNKAITMSALLNIFTNKTGKSNLHPTSVAVTSLTDNDITTTMEVDSNSMPTTEIYNRTTESTSKSVLTTIETPSESISETIPTTITVVPPSSSMSEKMTSTLGVEPSDSISKTFLMTTLTDVITTDTRQSTSMQTTPTDAATFQFVTNTHKDTTSADHEAFEPTTSTIKSMATAKSTQSNVILPVGGALGGLLVLVIVTIIVIKIRNRMDRGKDFLEDGRNKSHKMRFNDYHDITNVNGSEQTKYPNHMIKDDQDLNQGFIPLHDKNNYAMVQKKPFGLPQIENEGHFANDEQPINTRVKSCIIPRPQVDSEYDHIQRRPSGGMQISENLYGTSGDDLLYDASIHFNNKQRESDIYM